MESALTTAQKAALVKGGFRDVSDILLAAQSDVSRACHIPPSELNKIIDLICREHARPPRPLQTCLSDTNESFTTGDSELDAILGGGIMTAVVWEVVGESAAGKTQLALQLSLFVQLPPELGGLSGSACYITIASRLQTSRLQQILGTHPLLSPSSCTLSDVQTIQTPTTPKLIYVLSTFLPQYIDNTSKDPSSKPLKLLVIDALAELFHSVGKTTTTTLVERSRQLSEISSHLHRLANKYNIAVLVLNEVIDVVDRDEPLGDVLGYRNQSKLFGRADSIPGEDRKEAALGLVWANQVNTRMFLTRTGRRRYLNASEMPIKRSALDSSVPAAKIAITPVDDQPVLVRRLSVVFSSAAAPVSCDYVVTAEGISAIPGSTVSLPVSHTGAIAHPVKTSPSAAATGEKDHVAPLDTGYVADDFTTETSRPPTPENELGPTDDRDEWDSFWVQNPLSDDVLAQVDSSDPPSTSNA